MGMCNIPFPHHLVKLLQLILLKSKFSKQAITFPWKSPLSLEKYSQGKNPHFAGQISCRSCFPEGRSRHRRGSGSRRHRSWTIGERSTHCSTYMLHFAGIFPYIWVTYGKYMQIYANSPWRLEVPTRRHCPFRTEGTVWYGLLLPFTSIYVYIGWFS